MSTAIPHAPRCIVIAGPNGAGKTTFAREFLPRGVGVVHFVNADLIAAGLSPFRPALVALSAGRLLLRELDRLAASRADFALESTLSGRSYVGRLRQWKRVGCGERTKKARKKPRDCARAAREPGGTARPCLTAFRQLREARLP